MGKLNKINPVNYLSLKVTTQEEVSVFACCCFNPVLPLAYSLLSLLSQAFNVVLHRAVQRAKPSVNVKLSVKPLTAYPRYTLNYHSHWSGWKRKDYFQSTVSSPSTVWTPHELPLTTLRVCTCAWGYADHRTVLCLTIFRLLLHACLLHHSSREYGQGHVLKLRPPCCSLSCSCC